MAFIKELEKEFGKLIKENNLSQGYIFFGENRKIQHDYALKLASILEEKKKKDETPLIDVRVIAPREGSIGIDESRSLVEFLWQKPICSSRRTVIIQSADRLTIPAQNALLKIAEEPPEHGLIIVITTHLERLIPALASRFPKIYFSERLEKNDLGEASRELSQEFLKKDPKGRTEMLKSFTETPEKFEELVTGLLAEFWTDKFKKWPFAKLLIQRWQYMNQFNTNKKLQLEAALLRLPKL